MPLGGDGFMLETLHRFVGSGRADLRHASRQRRLSDELRTGSTGLYERLAAAQPVELHPLEMTATGERRRSPAGRSPSTRCRCCARRRQAAKLRVSVDEVVRLDELMADGILLCDAGRQHRLQSVGARADHPARRRHPGTDPDQRVPPAALARRAVAAWRAGARSTRSKPTSARSAPSPISPRCATSSRSRSTKTATSSMTLLFDREANLEERVFKEQFLS